MNGAAFLINPSEQQLKHLKEKQRAVCSLFNHPALPVITVSAATGWHLPELVEVLFAHCLPAPAVPSVRSIRPQYRTQKIEAQAQQDFGDTVSDVMTHTLSELSLPSAVNAVVSTVISAVVSVARSVCGFSSDG
ncbi:putative GTPase [Enterobacter cloacae]|uniref:Putative GTPase n=1 Tax=Enterobacter cloacae TaxID=550 RepID=A0A377LY56_ENTCL|nr:putative GTPase [Enterobacter cloacae]